jgi:cytochrome b561
MTDTQKTIAAYRAQQQRRQQIENLIANVLMGFLGAHVFAAVAYALIK